MSDDIAEARGHGWSVAARTHTGLRRRINQDTFICDPEQGLLAVIDGMGGPAAGEVAAAMTRDALLLSDDIRAALVQANGAVRRRAMENPAEEGMGCVATAVRLRADEIALAHVGDTRAYLASKAGCEQLTRDHTFVAEERERLGMTSEQARKLPNQHQVTRDVGGQPLDTDDWVDTGSAAISPGDVLLLCSDGLHDLVRDGELSRILGEARRPGASMPALAKALQELALERGGHDNVTVVVARRDGQTAPTEEPTVTEPAAEEVTQTQTQTQVTDEITTTLGGRRGCGLMFAASLGMSLALAGLGFLLGQQSVPEPPELIGAGWVHAAAAGQQLIAPGPAGLDGAVDGQEVTFTALGPLEAAGWSRTEIADGASVMLRAAALRFPPEARWQLAIGTGATVELSQLLLRAPEMSWELQVGPGATLVLSDSVVEVGRLHISGAPGDGTGTVVLRNTHPVLPEGVSIEVADTVQLEESK